MPERDAWQLSLVAPQARVREARAAHDRSRQRAAVRGPAGVVMPMSGPVTDSEDMPHAADRASSATRRRRRWRARPSPASTEQSELAPAERGHADAARLRARLQRGAALGCATGERHRAVRTPAGRGRRSRRGDRPRQRLHRDALATPRGRTAATGCTCVEKQATRWGVDREGGTRVWFEIAERSAELAP